MTEDDLTAAKKPGLVRRLAADERVRFLFVGGVNTLIGYGLFALFDLLLGAGRYLIALYLSYLIATMIAFVLHRRITFQLTGKSSIVIDYLRFASVYLVSLAINTALLPLFVEIFKLSPFVAQAIVVVITTILSYVGHKYFSFRRKPSPAAPADEATADTPE